MKIALMALVLFGSGAAYAGCIEGAKGSITKYDSSRDRTYTESRICRNGTYMNDEERAAYVYNPRTRCVEGARGWMTLVDRDGDSYTEARTCKNGSYMTDAERAAYVRVPKNKCKEGSYGRARASDYFPNENYGDHVPEITVVCRSGKWIPNN